MKKSTIPILSAMLLMFFSNSWLFAQTELQDTDKTAALIRNYQDLSGLGNPGSAYTDTATINAFRELFELNATHYWDLYRTRSPKSGCVLSVDDYLDSVNMVYNGLKPVVSYGTTVIKRAMDGRTTIVYMVKINSFQGPGDGQKHKFTRNLVPLKLMINLHGDGALIGNVARDSRLSRIRNLSVSTGVPIFSGISGGLFSHPVSNLDRTVASRWDIVKSGGYNLGVEAGIRIDRHKPDGLLLDAGICYAQTNYHISVHDYQYLHREIFRCPGSTTLRDFECTVADRTHLVTEKLSMSTISLPLTLKWYVPAGSAINQSGDKMGHAGKIKPASPFRVRFYLKGGLQISLLSAKADAGYNLSHKGEGKFYYVRDAQLPDSAREWFYLNDADARNSGVDFFGSRSFQYTTTVSLRRAYLSGVIAAGAEVKLNRFCIGIEPWFNAAITSISGHTGKTTYPLYPGAQFVSFIQTFNAPKINSIGINVIVGMMFNRKY